MREPDAYRCDFCGAEYEPMEFMARCHRDDDGNFEFRCTCGRTDYTELMECKFCHELHDIYQHKRLRWWKACNNCCEAAVKEFNEALAHITDERREILKQIYDIEPIKEV